MYDENALLTITDRATLKNCVDRLMQDYSERCIEFRKGGGEMSYTVTLIISRAITAHLDELARRTRLYRDVDFGQIEMDRWSCDE